MKQHFELIQFLIERDYKTKFRRAFLGATWSLLSPILHYFVICAVISQFVPGSKLEYSILFLTGALPFALFSACCYRAPFILLENQTLFRKAPLPKEIFVIKTVLFEMMQSLGLFLLLLAAGTLLGVLHFHVSWLWTLVAYGLGGFMMMGISSLLAVLTVYFRDVGYLMPVAMQTLFFISPVAYSVESAPAALRGFLMFNPLTLLIESVRQPLISGDIPWLMLLGLAVWSLGLYFVGRKLIKAFDQEIVLRL
jgi:ABC-type polysaccharide/polyol phosphate export permease